ncbi:MAG: polysaccharide deacetylase family protein [Acidobacteriaceae bacterium]|jgi:peptidoglycan/xylan/chitin deacetylase (PgdA/CDA1 family)
MPTALTPLHATLAATAAVAVTAGLTLTYAALSPGSQLFGHTIIAGSDPNEVALTYDDGPNDAATDALLDLLARHNARASFFMIGRFVRQRPEIVRRVHAAGHLIGNHTQTHPWLSFLSSRVICEELRACNQALEDTLGAPVHYLRPPHGARRPMVFRAAEELGLKIVQWNAMGYDWQPISPERIVANVTRGREHAQRQATGANILLHDGHQQGIGADRTATVRATAALLDLFVHEGARTVTVDAWV